MQSNGVLGSALLIGVGCTVVAGALPAIFKLDPPEPIYLWTMGLVVAGWAGALLYALAAERRAAAATMAAAGDDTRGVIDGMAQAMGVEMQRASVELLRVDELLGHAIEQLMAAFNTVSEHVSRHQNELRHDVDEAGARPDAESLRAVAEKVAREVNGAVTALQFRDVVGQKLGHVRRELEALEQVMQRVREASVAHGRAPQEARHASGQAELAARVRGLLREMQEAKAATPVRQELMHAGEVDLF